MITTPTGVKEMVTITVNGTFYVIDFRYNMYINVYFNADVLVLKWGIIPIYLPVSSIAVDAVPPGLLLSAIPTIHTIVAVV